MGNIAPIAVRSQASRFSSSDERKKAGNARLLTEVSLLSDEKTDSSEPQKSGPRKSHGARSKDFKNVTDGSIVLRTNSGQKDYGGSS